MKIEIPIDPATIPTAQEKGVRIVKVKGKYIPMFYKEAALQKFEKRLEECLKPYRDGLRIPDGKAVYLHITYLFPFPSSTPKRDRKDMTRMVQRPDGDNISKAVIDALADRWAKDKVTRKFYVARRGFFADDGAVNPLVISKFRTTEQPKIVIVLREQGDTLTKPLPNP